MSKKLAFIILLLLSAVTPSQAVLKEKDLSRTLSILRQELTDYHSELERQTGFLKEQRQTVMSQIISVLQHSQQNALMLYSQRNGNIFDLTYACHEATDQYQKFKINAAPFRQYIESSNVEVNRYDSLINDLSTMYTASLSEKSKIDRNVSLTLAVNIRRTLKDNRTQMEQYVRMYTFTENRLRYLNDYANKRYTDIQNSIFSNGGDNYFKIIGDLGNQLRETKQTVVDKYRPLKKVKSDWDSRVILGLLGVLIVGSLIAAFINYFFIGFLFTWLVKHNKINFIFEWFMKKKDTRDPKVAFQVKRTYIILAATVITFALILGMISITWNQNFIIMASSLLVEYAWLTGVILLSLLIRLDGEQIKSGFRIYIPIMAICLVVISFRIILIPNDLVNLVFPPILVGCALWQWHMMAKYQHKLPKSDVFYSYISMTVFIASVIAALVGYTLLSVEMLIWWTMQLTCILTITCISSMLKNFGNDEKRLYFDEETPITRSWFFRLIYNVVLPTFGALSVIIAIYWAADVFNMSETTWRIFNMRLIDSKNFTFSIYGVVEVIVLFFVFSFLNHTAIKLLQYNFWLNEQERAKEEERHADYQSVLSRIAMWRNVIQVFVWGVWLLISMNIFNINNSWLVAISAGLSTGIGFAMKDILENIYYGISLMAGRIKVGDYISIDGTRGTVKSISYVSTMLEAGDGSIIAFQNSQLFTKNYKNLTKNHGNEVDIIPVGVAYGCNAAEVREIIAEAVKAINKPEYIRFINVVFTGFGDNSIDFKVLSWVDARRQIYARSDIMEAIYKALNEHNIEIPYPQRDIHIVSDQTQEQLRADSIDEAMDAIRNEKQKG
ncbi:MAG: mechanosensitive ion channel family protein [Prevotella sp.]|nr:mechanosensitive ion channel family protein [Prevotella sp.]